ncbi:MAG: Gfo/Idh/MocA family protein [Terriglobales bacterium]
MTALLSSPTSVPRRDFLKAGGAAGALALAAPGRVLGANDRVRVCVCGVHDRGWDHIRNYAGIAGAEVAAICDVDARILRRRAAQMAVLGLPRPKLYNDPRRMLEDRSLDAVSIATPNHWHSLLGIWACQAGKDVYVEKPMCHYAWEGRQLVAAVNKYQRICQHGTQSRSMPAVRAAIRELRAGRIGDTYLARGLCYKWRPTIGHTPPAPVPPGLDYDLWTGPAPRHAFTANRFLYNWHWFWDYGNGDLGNQGIHQLDVARWGLDVAYPSQVSATGAKVLFDDDQQTPNLLNCAFQFDTPAGRRLLEFEVRGWITNHEAGIGTGRYRAQPLPGEVARPPKHWTWANTPMHSSFQGPVSGPSTIGEIFYGSKGYLVVDGDTAYRAFLGPGQDPGPGAHGGNERLHFENFIACVRTRRAEDLHAPIEEGYRSVLLVHLANASYLTGRTLHYDAAAGQVRGDDQANQLLRGHYRAPFTVPELV